MWGEKYDREKIYEERSDIQTEKLERQSQRDRERVWLRHQAKILFLLPDYENSSNNSGPLPQVLTLVPNPTTPLQNWLVELAKLKMKRESPSFLPSNPFPNNKNQNKNKNRFLCWRLSQYKQKCWHYITITLYQLLRKSELKNGNVETA